jgi:hypothetical protein
MKQMRFYGSKYGRNHRPLKILHPRSQVVQPRVVQELDVNPEQKAGRCRFRHTRRWQ